MILQRIFGIWMCLICFAPPQGWAARSAARSPAPALTPEQLDYFLRNPNVESLGAEETASYLESRREWPPGYEATIERFIRTADYAKGHFHPEEWARICGVFASHRALSAHAPDPEMAEHIAVAKIVRNFAKAKTEEPNQETISLVRSALKNDPLLTRAIAADTSPLLPEGQIKRLAPQLRPELLKSLRSEGRGKRHVLRAFEVLGLQDAEFHAEVAKMLQAGGNRSRPALHFIFEQIRNGDSAKESAAILNPVVANEIGLPQVDWHDERYRLWFDGVADDGPDLIQKLKSFHHVSPEGISQAIAKIGTTGDKASLAAALQALRGDTSEVAAKRFLSVMMAKENVEIIQDIDPERFADWYGDRPTKGIRASSQLDATKLADYFERATSKPGALAVTFKELEDLNAKQPLPDSIRQLMTKKLEEILSGNHPNALKQSAIMSVRHLRLSSPKIESTILTWMPQSNALRLNSDDGLRARDVLSEGLEALGEIQEREGLQPETLEALSTLGPRPHLQSRMGIPDSPPAFFHDGTNEYRLLQRWISLQEKLGPRTSVEKELLELLEMFRKSQLPGFKATMTVETARHLFETVTRLEPKSDGFSKALREIFDEPRMRRAALEFSPEIFRTIQFPITDSFKNEILHYRLGKNFEIDQELHFLKKNQASLADFLGSLSSKDSKAEVVASVLQNRTAHGEGAKPADVSLFPNSEKSSAKQKDKLLRHKLGEPARARLEAAIGDLIAEPKTKPLTEMTKAPSFSTKCASWFAKLFRKKP